MFEQFYDSHMHTHLCRHASGEPEEYAAVAESRGLAGIIITCHNPLPGGYSQSARMYCEQFGDYVALVRRAAEAWAGRVDIRLGLECDVVPGMEDFLRQQTSSQPFDYILGSVHPQIAEFRQAHWKGNIVAFQRTYFEQLAWVAETGIADCLTHPDLVKNTSPAGWDLPRVIPDIRRALDRIAATGCAMELNTSGVNKEIPQMNPAPEILREMRLRDIPVVIGSDAHEPGRVGDGFEAALDLLAAAGYESTSIFMQRQRHEISLAAARACLREL